MSAEYFWLSPGPRPPLPVSPWFKLRLSRGSPGSISANGNVLRGDRMRDAPEEARHGPLGFRGWPEKTPRENPDRRKITAETDLDQ